MRSVNPSRTGFDLSETKYLTSMRYLDNNDLEIDRINLTYTGETGQQGHLNPDRQGYTKRASSCITSTKTAGTVNRHFEYDYYSYPGYLRQISLPFGILIAGLISMSARYSSGAIPLTLQVAIIDIRIAILFPPSSDPTCSQILRTNNKIPESPYRGAIIRRWEIPIVAVKHDVERRRIGMG